MNKNPVRQKKMFSPFFYTKMFSLHLVLAKV